MALGFVGSNVGRAVVGFKVGAPFGDSVGMTDGWKVGWDVGCKTKQLRNVI